MGDVHEALVRDAVAFGEPVCGITLTWTTKQAIGDSGAENTFDLLVSTVRFRNGIGVRPAVAVEVGADGA